MKKDICIAFSARLDKFGQVYPLIQKLRDRITHCYGVGTTKKETLPEDYPFEIMSCVNFNKVIMMAFVNPFIKLLKFPDYYHYWANVKILDWYFSHRIKHDKAKLLYTTPLFNYTIRVAKKKGMTVIINAGNSEPAREHRRICEDYERFGIKHRYIYGGTSFRDTCLESMRLADKIISISETSLKTYLEAGFDPRKLTVIPLTGTDFPLQPYEGNIGKQKAFISTAFHNFIKGTQELLLAWKKANIVDIPLIIVGRLCDDMREFIAKYGPFDNVIYEGHRADLRDWYSTRDAVGVLLSLSEGAVRVTPEMMSFGFPMIVSPDATCDLVEDGKNGFIIDTHNIDEIAARLKWFASDWNRVHAMRQNILDSVSHRTVKDFSLECADYITTLI